MELIEAKYIWIQTENEEETKDLCEYLVQAKEVEITKQWINTGKYLIKTNNLSFNRANFQRWRSLKYKKENDII